MILRFGWLPALVILVGCIGNPQKTAPLPSFEEASARTGLSFQHFTGATGEYYLPEIMGSGAVLFDFDNDGDLDVFFPQGSFIDRGRSERDALFPLPEGFKPGGRLFRNELNPRGRLTFTDVTGSSGLVFPGYGMGAAIGDIDNNGTLDLLVTGLGRCALFRNNGNGTFTDITKDTGISDDALSMSAAFLDYDRDGRLDLFVTHYVHGSTLERKKCGTPAGEMDYCSPRVFSPAVARLYHNEGHSRFRDVTVESGIGSAAGPGLGVAVSDFNGDGWPDILVANDGAASFLWINQKNGTFRESGLEFGLAYNNAGKAQAGMGLALGDVDNDGTEEIVKTNLYREGVNLYRKVSPGLFTDAAEAFQLLSPTYLLTGFGTGLFDFDNDGWLDLFITNGAVTIMEEQRGARYPYRQSNLLLHNERGKFRPVPAPALAEKLVGRGAAFGDIDNDGDIDIVVSNNNGPARLYLNTLSKSGFREAHWLRVRLEGSHGDRFAFHALITLVTRSGKKQVRRIQPDGSYLSMSDPSAHFGLGAEKEVKSLTVLWPDGSRSLHSVASVDREIRIKQP